MRNVSSLALIMPEYEGQTWLFDCGEATQHQIQDSPVKLSKLSHIWITHLHGDHIYGLPGVLGSRSFQGAETPLTVYGPPGLADFIEVTLKTSQTFLRYPLKVKEIADGNRFTEGPFSILVKKLDHGIPSFGFRLAEKEQPGRLDAKRLKELGITPGPIYKELKQGKTVCLPDGRRIDGNEFLSPPVPGRTIAILGDTRFTQAALELSDHADLLIHESTYRSGQEDLAFSFFHSTCTQAATVAKESGTKHLILNHISSRFQEKECAELLEEARAIFPQTILAYDGFQFELPRKGR
jgi:ribonuclease Z